MINKPYYRIYRPFNIIRDGIQQWSYIEDARNCATKEQLIRVYQILEAGVIGLFQYVEPEQNNQDVFSLRLYHLLVKICIEIENNFKGIIQANDYNKDLNKCDIQDYFKLNKFLKLNEYRTTNSYFNISVLEAPYEAWNKSTYDPLPWYQAYNNVKHNREPKLKEANFKHVLSALTGLYILLYAQFYFYADCVSSNICLTMTPTKGVSNTSNIDRSIIVFPGNLIGYNFSSQPKWTDDEKYSFDWNILANDASPFQKLNILPTYVKSKKRKP